VWRMAGSFAALTISWRPSRVPHEAPRITTVKSTATYAVRAQPASIGLCHARRPTLESAGLLGHPAFSFCGKVLRELA
jgi:hypothetical protein